MEDDDIPEMIRDCVNRESKLSEWDRGFIQSISEQYDRSGSLSPKQKETLDKIWEKVT